MASEQFTYRFTKVAEADIDETLSYITNRLGNPDAATDFADERSHSIVILRVVYGRRNQDNIVGGIT